MDGSAEAKLKLCVRQLCEYSDNVRETLMKYLSFKNFTPSDLYSLKISLSEFLLKPDLTIIVAQCFPHIILELLLIAEESGEKSELTLEDKSYHHQCMCIALGKLVNIHPDAIRFSLQYFESNPPPFHDITTASLSPSSRKKLKLSPTKIADYLVSDLEIVKACYSFLHISNDYFREHWNWSDFIELYVGHEDEFICWLACQCVSVVVGMTDKQIQEFVSGYLSPEAIRSCIIKFDSIQTEYSFMKNENPSTDDESSCDASFYVASICGIQLPVVNPEAQDRSGCLVHAPSTVANLKSLALALASGRAICLQGPVGCGKTSLVEHLALLTGRVGAPEFTKVQLGDQTDSKMLLGTYRCTDIPGEFIWQPGVLTQAVIGGHWILLEDIDSAAADVMSVLTSLIETGTLSVPGYRDSVKISPGFQLFVTKRLMPNSSGFDQLNAPSLIQKHWVQVHVEPLSKEELIDVVQAMFPLLSSISARIVDVFLLFSAGNDRSALQLESDSNPEIMDTSSPELSISRSRQRLISTRDLIKWCTRSIEGFDVSSQDSALKVFQDAIDVFCCSFTNPVTRLKLAISIGAYLGIVKTRAEYFCINYKPDIKISSLRFMAGRVILPRESETVAHLESFTPSSSFAFTHPTACLLERLAYCVAQIEPVLLVGETGTGKTSAVQYLANKTGHQLIVINMNQQSDSADLLGGYKPVDLKYIVGPVRDEFEMLFRSYFLVPKNIKFLHHIATCYNSRRWNTLLRLMKHSHNAAMNRLLGSDDDQRRYAWEELGGKLLKLETQLKTQSALAFTFIEGSIVKAVREGYWVLLDEINLASAETLECLSGLLEGSAGSLYLLERGDQELVQRHPDFRLFACMNPATDVGKKELPAGLRNRFTEFFVDELTERSDLLLLVGTYLQDLSLSIMKLESIVKFYLSIRKEAAVSLTDGTGHKPCYSLRTLCRALSVAAQNKCGSVQRSLYEALCLSFLTQLDYSSHPLVEKMIAKAVMGSGDVNSILQQPIPHPSSIESEEYVCFEGYWVARGSLNPEIDEKYIITQSVRRNLRDLVRIVSIGHHPVLLQGETSVGKTSLITYLARASGNYCVRINNHEHTDLQEYIGSYSADENGHLIFQEGVLVEAMRKGHWIILDELNLAPTDVLEALNRVLDDNRELFIPETQEIVKAHPQFMLFATQNPPGLYGGRKVLSRAFRNRFVELHFDEIPANELEIILHKRCDLPLSYCTKMVAVMADLQVRRKGSAAFAGKQGFITLRDLFRWGERYRLAGEQQDKFYDWSQHIADEGYLVLAGRVRKQEECLVIQEVIKKHINKTVEPDKLFTLNEETSSVTRPILEQILTNTPPGFEHIVWTFNMRRLAVLVGKAFLFKEPVLLVGETGCGKTTVCQILAAIYGQKLYTINCHMHTESADFLGGLRPVRDHSSDAESVRLFEWVDGPLIEAMQNGDLFLADEISLADDSVLERLNSLLEPERKLLLSEKGGEEIGTDASCVIVAQENFHIIGTMNPGGDYGKKELSPALRNRFTEIWCESCRERGDLIAIIEHNLNPGLFLGNHQDGTSGVGNLLLDFIEWFIRTDIGKRFTMSVRDILSWVNFINTCTKEPCPDSQEVKKLDVPLAYIHGACLTFLDSLGSGVTSIDSVKNLKALCKDALKYLMGQVELDSDDIDSFEKVITTETYFGIHPFYIKRGSRAIGTDVYTFSAKTTGLNASRVLRALQLRKPVLLEGSPGVGKTSLVAALAKAAGYHLTRINLSDQTDVSDLFGADLPIEGGGGGQFAWRDGPFLRALKAGHWILLDELNLASQSVLEGLNACLDHRGEVFIPELGKTFHIQSQSTRLFGAQNPLRQGGARRGLPRSFLNRFTQVYMDSLTEADLEFIIRSLFPILPEDLIYSMVMFNSRLAREIEDLRLWGQKGSPWELNLRDLTRWCEAVVDDYKNQMFIEQEGKNGLLFRPGKFVDLIYMDRMRTKEDKEKVMEIYIEEFGSQYALLCDFPRIHLTPSTLLIDDVALSRDGCKIQRKSKHESVSEAGEIQSFSQQQSNLMLLRRQFPALRSLSRCVNMNWLAVLVGPSGSGKTSLVHLLSQLVGQELCVLSVNSAMDTMEILGGFEQADYNRHLDEIAACIERLLLNAVRRRLLTTIDSSLGSPRPDVTSILRQWEAFTRLAKQDKNLQHTPTSEIQLFKYRITSLLDIVNLLFPEFEGQHALESELRVVKGQLLKLANAVTTEGNLNAGGKFEWLDSVLVKCVQDGTWLLIDNVNLCSPAVLDRLNALLEPNGVLTIGERGVGPDGQLVTITPHPNFRLFMTMDPHNGEISRAMRNRGVEIYMLGSNEEEYSTLDLRSLMYHIGLKIHSHQDTLLSVHEVMRQNNQGINAPGIAQLLHAAYLIAQQTSLGQPLYEAFLSSCSDVYVKPYTRRVVGTIGFLTFGKSLYDVLKETLSFLNKKYLKNPLGDKLLDSATLTVSRIEENSVIASIKQQGSLLLDSATLTVPRIKENSVFASVKQQGSLLKALLEIVTVPESDEYNERGDMVKMKSVSNTEILNQLLGLEGKYSSEVKIVDIIPHSLLIFYDLATPNDIELRHEWLTEVITKCKARSTDTNVLNILNKSLKISETLRNAILQTSLPTLNEHKNLIKHVCNIDDLPWDIRWLPCVAMLCRHTDQLKCPMCIAANKLSLLLYFKTKKIQSETLTEELYVGERNSLTVEEYSSALMNGTLSDVMTSDPVVTRFSPLLHVFDECLEAALKCENTSLDTAQCRSLQDALDWRFRFAQLGSLQLINREEKDSDRSATMLIDETVSKLRVHFNWLSKWTFPKLVFLLEQDSMLRNSPMTKQFECLVKEIESSIVVSLSVLIPLGKKMKLVMGHPLPHTNTEQVQLLDQMQRLSDVMSLWQFGSSIRLHESKELVDFLRTKKGLKSRLDLIFGFKQILQEGDTDQVEHVIIDVERSVQEAGFIKVSADICTDREENPAMKEPNSSSNVELWPVQDLVCLLLSGALKKSLLWNILVMNLAREQNSSPDIPTALRLSRPSLQDIARNVCSLMLPLPTIPPVYTAMVEILNESEEFLTSLSSDMFRNVVPSLMIMMLQHSEFSPSVNQLKKWISWNHKTINTERSEDGTKMDWLESNDIREESLPLHCPVMTELVTSFALQNCQNNDIGITLLSHTAQKLQLSVMKEVLWRNMIALSSPLFNNMLNDAHSAHTYFQIFIQSLQSVVHNFTTMLPKESLVVQVETIVQALTVFSFNSQRLCEETTQERKIFADILIILAETVTKLKKTVTNFTKDRTRSFENASKDKQILFATGEIWTFMGLLQVMMYGNLGLIDPVIKKKLKLQYISEEAEETENLLYAQELQSCVCSRSLNEFDEYNMHPYILVLRGKLEHLVTRHKEFKKCVAVRPEPPLFDALAKEALHYSRSLSSPEVVLNMHKNILNMIKKLSEQTHDEQEEMLLINRAEEILNEVKVWQESQQMFCDRFNKKYCHWYPDMVVPLISAATQLQYGMQKLASLLRKQIIQAKVVHEEGSVDRLLHNLVCFPSLGSSQESVLSLVNTCTSSDTFSVIDKTLDSEQLRKEKYRLLKSGLEELKNLVMVKGDLQPDVWASIEQLLSQIVHAWRRQEDERKQLEKEKESLFVTKDMTYCKTPSEEEQMAAELEQLFPSSSTDDFGDLQQQATLEQIPARDKNQNESVVGFVTEEVMDYVCQLHSHIVQSYTSSSWLLPVLGSSKYFHLRPDFIKPLLERYKIFGMLLEKLSRSLNSSLDVKLYPSLSILVSVTLNMTDRGRVRFCDAGDLALLASPSRHIKLSSITSSESKTFDFYKDSYVKEVKQCFPVLMDLDTRIKELLVEWPEHPTLQQISTIIERIMKFPLTSPVARFMAGLEILLDKMHEWEENAHSGVSLMAHWKAVTEQIGSWRKLELQCWKYCLDNVANKIKIAASKWWFYIYSLVESRTSSEWTESDETQSAEELIKTLQRFMEQSTLGEFEARLNILFSFHCHVVHLPQTSQKDELMNILWNVYNFYNQFSEAVASKIRELRSPIEKKLKDCVKIFRWTDISHWAIKEAIKKTHRTLHKHIKEFQEVLNQPVKEALTTPTSEAAEINVGAWDRPQRHQPRLYQSLLEPMNFISNLRLKKMSTEAEKEGTLLSRAGTLHTKARKLCRQTIMNTPYARYIQSVDSLVTEVLETSNRLKNLSVSEDISKAKRKSQIKNFLQQKQKALTDLFRTLQQIGLSYRTGLTHWNIGDTSTVEFRLPPLQLRASFLHLKNRRVDGPLLSLWDGSETYFQRSIARLALLNAVLQNPAKDLSPPSLERCRGFATHLMVLSREQKQSLCESSQLLCSLRCQVKQLIALEDTDVLLPNQSTLQNWHGRLKNLLVTSIICLEQFRIFLYCCPSKEEQHVASNCDAPVVELPGLKCPSIVQATKGDDLWNSAVEKVKSLIISLTKLKCSVEKFDLVPSSLYTSRTEVQVSVSQSNVFVARPLCEMMVDGYKQIQDCVKEINKLKIAFENSYKPEQCFVRVELLSEIPEDEENTVNPMTQSLTWLQCSMEKEVKEFNSFMKENITVKSAITASLEGNVEGPIVAKFREDTEIFMKNVLLVVQEIYKKYTQNSDMSVVNGEEKIETENAEQQNKGNIANDQGKEETHNEKQNKGDVEDGDDEEETKIEDGHLKEKVIDSLTNTLSILQMKKINDELHELLQRIMDILDLENGVEQGNICKRLLLHCLPCLDQLVLLCQFFVTQQVASYRVSCKLLSVLLAIFIELAQKGFCLPQEVTSDEDRSQDENKAGGLGLGEGEGEKDISDQIESEEQLEEARPKGEEKTEEDKECKEEEKGIEMTEDFEGKVQDLEKKEDEENDSDKDDNEEEPDKEMGETETGADNLDQQIWGSDSEEDGEGEPEEEEEKEEEKGSGEKIGTSELGAKEDSDKPVEDEKDDEENEKHETKKKEINEMEDGDENEDQIDPYHGKQEPQPEPEPLDLPEDLQLDDGNEKKGDDVEEENPFDIDKMKEQKTPEQEDKDKEDEEMSEDKEEANNASDEEMEVEEEKDENERKQEQEETEKENEEGVEDDKTGGGSKDEEKSGEEPKLEPEKEIEEVAEPSEDKPSHNPTEAAVEMDETLGSKDQVISEKDSEATQQPKEDTMAEGKDDKQGVGQAQAEETDSGHQGQITELKENVQAANPQQELKREKRQHFQESDSNRSLGEVTEPVKKKLKTMNLTSEEEIPQEDKNEEEAKTQENGELYQHIKEAKKSIDVQTLDAATEEQAEQQPVPNLENEEGEEMKEDDDDVEIQSEPKPEESEAPKLDAAKVPGDKQNNEKEEKTNGEKTDEGGDIEMVMEVEGEKVETLGAARGNETTFHTVITDVHTVVSQQDMLPVDDHQLLRSQLENQLATWSQPPPDAEAEKAWEMFSAITAGLARDLSEQLRLVLEPTQASRLRGDYRTGRRINMRKVIPYIASQFRKDKIWLRRTKPSKREYQIVLAIDDSSSMADNHSKELAFESLALVSRALTLLEAGELSVISFGESPRILHKLGDPFTDQSGARLLQQFSFEQKNTRVGQLVDFATTMFMSNCTRATSNVERAQLLVIVSDGRIISEGTDKVKQAVRRAKQNQIFMVFLIIDNPESKDSILDIQQPLFIDNKCVGFTPYLDNFPFPFYLILRDINALPTVLSDALRQWFELVTNMDK